MMMKQYLVVVECALGRDGKFLIIKRPVGKHAVGLLSFPGGTVEEQDEVNNYDVLRSAVKREILEELGLNLEDSIDYVTTGYFTDSAGMQVIDSVFYCKLDKTVPEVVASRREVPEYFWMSKDEIKKIEEFLKKAPFKFTVSNAVEEVRDHVSSAGGYVSNLSYTDGAKDILNKILINLNETS